MSDGKGLNFGEQSSVSRQGPPPITIPGGGVSSPNSPTEGRTASPDNKSPENKKKKGKEEVVPVPKTAAERRKARRTEQIAKKEEKKRIEDELRKQREAEEAAANSESGSDASEARREEEYRKQKEKEEEEARAKIKKPFGWTHKNGGAETNGKSKDTANFKKDLREPQTFFTDTDKEQDVTVAPTSTKFTRLSRRVEGLMVELMQVVTKQDAYCLSQSSLDDVSMQIVYRKLQNEDWAERWKEGKTTREYHQDDSCELLEALLMKQIAFMIKPRRILQIGMFGGLAATAILEGTVESELIILELDPYVRDHYAESVKNFQEMTARCKVITGRPVDKLSEIYGEFDLICISGEKSEYRDICEKILEEGRLSPLGIILCSQVLHLGSTFVSPHLELETNRRSNGDFLDLFNEWVCNRSDLVATVLPLFDGMSIIRRKEVAVSDLEEVMSRKYKEEIKLDPELQMCPVPEPGSPMSGRRVPSRKAKKVSGRRQSSVNAEDLKTDSQDVLPPMSVSSMDSMNHYSSTAWKTLPNRINGLLSELSEFVGKRDEYCIDMSAESPAMKKVRFDTLAEDWAGLKEEKKTISNFVEEMTTDTLEVLLLREIVFMMAPRRVLEIGMFVGYATTAILEGSMAVEVVSLEVESYFEEFFKSALSDYPSYLSRHQVIVGEALETIPSLQGEFDLIFIDAHKAEYKRYIEEILEHNLLSPTGMFVCDNVMYSGCPYTVQHFDSQPTRRILGDAVRGFNQWVVENLGLEQLLLPLRSGMSIIRRREDSSKDGAATGSKVYEPEFDATDKYICVVGGTAGLGKGIALLLAAANARGLLIHATSEDGKREVFSRIRKVAPQCEVAWIKSDLRSREACEKVTTTAFEVFPRLDGFVYNEAACFPPGALNPDEESLRNKACFMLTESIMSAMCENEIRGSVINIIPSQSMPDIMSKVAQQKQVYAMYVPPIRVNTIDLGGCVAKHYSKPSWKGMNWLQDFRVEHVFGELHLPSQVEQCVGRLLTEFDEDDPGNVSGALINFAPQDAQGIYK